MYADIKFPNVEFYGSPTGQLVRVRVGEKFTVDLTGITGEPEIVWATTADPVLMVQESATSVQVMVETPGTSELQVQVNRAVVHYIVIEAFDPDEAVSLNPSTKDPEPK